MLGSQEMILIFIVVILLFGASKLPELARSMGKSTGEFKKAQRESELEIRNIEGPLKDKDATEKVTK
jgi:sec-independent protein translocase protein TatA